MKTKTLEDILFQVYELGVQQTDCDITENANTIMVLVNKRVIEELEELLTKEIESFGVNVISSQAVINKIKQLKQD